ncbi:hypothetical protein LRR81_14070 [Metabacillus sp. GX 13764]|uniref:hypothetical protein n=1 Tax=Metabacillus kandeliae TaxID=2900151 RepID=UPI001E49CF42|nr:hypothetical protein [Metabacillus kandeliae]MCD7035367.1 hypothetical protein [Metabacillus kandeliae]
MINKHEMIVNVLLLMSPKIKKSLLNTDRNDREDLEQEIKLKLIEAVFGGRISPPPTFLDFQEEFNQKNQNAAS